MTPCSVPGCAASGIDAKFICPEHMARVDETLRLDLDAAKRMATSRGTLRHFMDLFEAWDAVVAQATERAAS